MKKVTALLLALVLCFGVTVGCKKKDSGAADSGSGDTAAETDGGAADDGGSTDGGGE